MKTTALIMAGGRGERFWPRSRKRLPKQFLCHVNGERTMVQLTVDRIRPLVDVNDIFIATNYDFKEIVKEQIPDIPEENIICEPEVKNTAPCIGLAAIHIKKKYDDAQMIVLPSDHLIKNSIPFEETIKKSLSLSERTGHIITIGIQITHPESGYGYIKFNPRACDLQIPEACEVEQFIEKPAVEVAKEYLDSGEYLWSSGMFVCKASTILNLTKQFLPSLYDGLMEIQDTIGTKNYQKTLKKQFHSFDAVSISYGIMEKTAHVYVIKSSLGWDDVGSWLALERLKNNDENGSVCDGNVISINSSNNIIQGKKRLIAAVGVKNLVIVDSDDAILICDKKSVGEIKNLVQKLKFNHEEYL